MKNFSQAFAKRCPSLWQKPSRGRPPFGAKNGLRTPGGSFDSAAAGSRPARLGAFERPSMRPRKQDAAGSMPAQGSNGIKLAEARLGKKIRFTPSGENAAELFMTSLEKRFEFGTREAHAPDGSAGKVRNRATATNAGPARTAAAGLTGEAASSAGAPATAATDVISEMERWLNDAMRSAGESTERSGKASQYRKPLQCHPDGRSFRAQGRAAHRKAVRMVLSFFRKAAKPAS